MSRHLVPAALAGDEELVVGEVTLPTIKRAIGVRWSAGRSAIVTVRRTTHAGAACGELRVHPDSFAITLEAIAAAQSWQRGASFEHRGLILEVGGGGRLGVGLAIGPARSWLDASEQAVLEEAITIASQP